MHAIEQYLQHVLQLYRSVLSFISWKSALQEREERRPGRAAENPTV